MPEKRIVLENCGVIDPSDINTYLSRDGFKALEKARKHMTPQQVINEVKRSGLRGRGGAGFPTGLKWELCTKSPEKERFVICNADEGEVGTFKDRYIIQNDPFGIIEGIALAGYAIGASKGYIYLRAEYHYLRDLLENAIEQAKTKGFLGEKNNESFGIEVREGAGAYVCGEETALMESIEGKRGEARYRPPFPPEHGLWQKPTSINNVETLANIPHIIFRGAEWFSQIGTQQSKGTKVFSVSGDVEKPGIYELPMGTPLRELVEELAQAKDLKAAQVGGASGRLIPEEKLDTPLAFETVLGAGAVIVFSKGRNIIQVVRRNIEFFAEESCGKCVPCREGTQVMSDILRRFSLGQGTKEDLTILEELSNAMMLASLCGLGQAAPNSVSDSLLYFRSEYDT
ncbi:MAG: NADH-ubiquinone oxidoreductase-F iron-sulfur binding region domain-containing protein [Thermodesulfovibrionales bacterium]|nr:NADH-ubiquinone oxidoreductase-F iron-sulfur binding region domain-containing protein [Thermodesulfovibrionales bacterium]